MPGRSKLKKAFGKQNDSVLRRRYREVYGEAGFEEKYREDIKNARTRYLLVAAVFLLAIVFSIHAQSASNSMLNVEDGRIVSITRPEKDNGSLSVDLDVSATDGKTSVKKGKQILVSPKGTEAQDASVAAVIGEESDREKLERKIDSAVRNAAASADDNEIVLPLALEDGIRLRWDLAKNTDVPMLVAGFILAAAALYRSRFAQISRAEKEAKDSVAREMPAFMNKMLLLIDGGLVLMEAFDRAVLDAKKRGLGESSYFYRQMIDIKEGAEKSNEPIHEGLSRFAQRSGVRELMRFSGMVSDNIEKGADISGKLEAEGRMLWFLRKKRAEEAGRLAETKLSVPLMILVLDLIGVTCAPALLQM